MPGTKPSHVFGWVEATLDEKLEGLLQRVPAIVIPSPVKAARRATSTMEF